MYSNVRHVVKLATKHKIAGLKEMLMSKGWVGRNVNVKKVDRERNVNVKKVVTTSQKKK